MHRRYYVKMPQAAQLPGSHILVEHHPLRRDVPTGTGVQKTGTTTSPG